MESQEDSEGARQEQRPDKEHATPKKKSSHALQDNNEEEDAADQENPDFDPPSH